MTTQAIDTYQDPSAPPPALATPPRVPYLTLRATSGWAALKLGELWHFRDLMFTLADRDIKVRYKQTVLGVAWVILQPLLAAGALSFVFGKVAKLPSDDLPYFVFSFAGLLLWNVFANTLSKTSNSMLGNTHLISKVYFPRLILPISSTFSTLIDFAVALAMMGVLMIAWRLAPGWGLLLLPAWLFFAILLSMGVGLMAAALLVRYRDVGYILPVATQLLMYVSPIAYSVSAVPAKWRFIYFLNPVTGLLEAFRWSLLNHGSFPWPFVLYAVVISSLIFLAGAMMFKRMERTFVDVI